MTVDLKRFQMCVEVSKGHRLKRDNHGRIEFVSPFRCPFNYGSLMGVKAADGDLADAILLGESRKRGTVFEGELVAIVRFMDKGTQDDKWILSETGQFSHSEYTQIRNFFRVYVILKNIQHTLMSDRLQSQSQLQRIECMIEPRSVQEEHTMSAFQLRRRIKDFAKGILGLEGADTSPPNWQSRPPNYPETQTEPQDESVDSDHAAEAPSEQESAPATASADGQTNDVVQAPSSNGQLDTAGEPLSLEAVQEVLDDMVRPALQGDGGDITLIKIEDNNIFVQLVGACSSCPSSTMTMRMGVEALLREEFPAMKELIDVTNTQGAEA